MTFKKGFWHRYYKAKRLSGEKFFKNRFKNIEMVIFAFLVAIVLSFADDLFIFNRGLNPSTKTKFLVVIFIISVQLYRHFLYKKYYPKV